jgi:hypothetical protein
MWGINSSLEPLSSKLELRAFDLLSDWRYTEMHEVTLAANRSTELLDVPCSYPPAGVRGSALNLSEDRCSSVVASVRLLLPNADDVLARFADWLQSYRHGTYPAARVAINMRVEDEVTVISVDRPVKALLLHLEDEDETEGGTDHVKREPRRSGVRLSDNSLDVVPGDPQAVRMTGYRSWRELAVARNLEPRITYRYFQNTVS